MPTGVYVRSEAHRKKIGDRTRGKKRPPRSEEWCRKISQANKGRKNPHTAEWNAKIGKGNKGKIKSLATIEKLRLAASGKSQSKETIAKRVAKMLGHPTSEATRKKIADGRLGSNNPYWKGGISGEPGYHETYTIRYRARRRGCPGSHTPQEWVDLKATYNWTCPWCARAEPEITLTRDHVVPLSEKGSNDISNIQPLCRSCNSKKQVKTIRFEVVKGAPV